MYSQPTRYAWAVAWLTVFAALSVQGPRIAYAEPRTLDFGIPTAFISGAVNPQDAKAGMKLWLEEMTAATPLFDKVTPHYVEDYEDLKEVLDSKAIDLIFLPTPYYIRLKNTYCLEPGAVAIGSNGMDQQYMLIVNKDSGITSIDELAGKPISIMSEQEHDIVGREWIRILLKNRGLPCQENFFSKITIEPRPSRVIIQLFFNKIEVGLVTKYAFDVMAELNPQIPQHIKMLAVSPSILSHVLCFTSKIDKDMKKTVLDTALRIQELPRGQQIYTLFQLSNLLVYKKPYIDSAETLFTPTAQECPY
ncbi:phosphate/phosphite/phosphonate ABC transporter substrate-binding protein [Desulfoplanes sp.]